MRRFCVTAPNQGQVTICSWSENIVVAALRVQVQRGLDFRVTRLGSARSPIATFVGSLYIPHVLGRADNTLSN